MTAVSISRSLLFRVATSDRFERALRSLPSREARAYAAAERYVGGTTREEALEVAKRLVSEGFAAALDFFGEDERDPVVAAGVADAYVELARLAGTLEGDVTVALDLSHFALDTRPDEARAHLVRIAAALPGDRVVQVGAEDSWRADAVLDAVIGAHRAGARVMATLQANLHRSAADGDRLAEEGIPIRLVKGAYVEPRSIAYPYGEETNAAYARLAQRLARAGARVVLATHDPVLRELLPDAGVEALLGVRPDDARAAVAAGRHTRIYVPYGAGWFRYWMRRVAESRGA
jgi:proline dehydrogenase